MSGPSVKPVRRRLPRWKELSPLVRGLLVLLLVVVLVAAGLLVWNRVWHCAPDLVRTEGQCIGITDGTDGPVLGEGTAAGLRAIGEENSRLATLPPGTLVRDVALLLPMPAPGTDPDYAGRLAGDVQGVATAQRQANRTDDLGRSPLIRVLVANVGDSAHPAPEPVDRLIEMATTGPPERRLMAVVVTGKSMDPLLGQINRMVEREVPVVVSHLTADQITPDRATANSSLVRVAPTTDDEGAALAAYLEPGRRVLVVQDTNPADRYASQLGEGFRRHYRSKGTVLRDEVYNGGWDGAANAMLGIAANICSWGADTVFFAGRAEMLSSFVAALANRPCTAPIRVLTGDDGISFGQSVAVDNGLRAGLGTNVSVLYTALAHPAAWQQPESRESFAANAHAKLTGQCENVCFPSLFPGASLEDSYVVMAYDAVVTLVAGLRAGQAGGQVAVRSPQALLQMFKQMKGARAVAGASGWISLTAEGNTFNKAVAILVVSPEGRGNFVKLSSLTGQPCIPLDERPERQCQPR